MENLTALDTSGRFDLGLQRGERARCRDEAASRRRRDTQLTLVEPVDGTARREALGEEGTLAARKFDDDRSIDRVGRRRCGTEAHVRPGQKELIARLLGVSRQTLYDILDEKQPVTPGMALRLGKLLGNGPDLWINLQRAYDLAVAERNLAAKLKKIPTLTAA